MKLDPQIKDELLTVRDWLRFAASEFARAQLFFGHGTNNCWDEAAALLLHVLVLPNDKLAEVADARLTGSEKQALGELIETRITTRKPLPYLTGEAYFAGLKFEVNEDVLIPRSPFAELIERQFQPWLVTEPLRILDLCTGSGCIGIACAASFPNAVVELSDISIEALAVARRNVDRFDLGERVTVIESDLFAALQGPYDLIVCNPPYVDAVDMANLPMEYQVEPRLALASGIDGLDFTRRLLDQVHDYLTADGLLVVEVGNSWEALEAAYPEVGFTWLDLEQGGHGLFALSKEQLSKTGSN